MNSMARQMFELVERIGVIPYSANETHEAMCALGSRRTTSSDISQNATGMEVRVRQATIDEAPALAALHRRTALFAYASIFLPRHLKQMISIR